MVEASSHSTLELPRQRVHPWSWRASSVSQDASLSPRWRLLILAPLALFLVWEVLTRSLVAYLADASPETAIRLRSNDPNALLNLAYDRLNRDATLKKIGPVATPPRDDSTPLTIAPKGVQSTKEIDLTATRPDNLSSAVTDPQTMAQARSWVETALLEDPLNARALSILGQLSRGTSETSFMQAAARRSHLESMAVLWMMRKNYEEGDYRSAIQYADILLRTRPQAPQAAMVALGRLAEIPGANAELKRLLKSNPRWRSTFFSLLPANISDGRTPLDLLLALKNTPTPPTNSELSPYLKFLIEHGLYELAYYTWLQFLPPEEISKAGYLFNGSFETTPSGLPFDWTFDKESGVTIEIADRTDGMGAHALFMEFGVGRVEGLSVAQVVVLPPGDYQFKGAYKADIVSQRGLQWRVVCANKAKPVIGESPTVIGAESDWREFEFAFTVPDADCPAQSVQLAFTGRSASEQFVSGSVWFDDLHILRQPSLAEPSASR
jgi:hypothetical protein